MVAAMRLRRLTALLVLLSAVGCGSSRSSAGPTNATHPAAPSPRVGQMSPNGAGALSAEAASAATGDIPDTQVFLVYTSKRLGLAMKYPEGWTQSAAARSVTFSDKNNLVRVVISPGTAPTQASITSELRRLVRSTPSLTFATPRAIQLPAGPAVAARYRTLSAPNPVTGKRVTLVVERYELSSRGRVATVDLGTPVGVDNVDAYRMMIRSFRWR